MGCLSLSHRIDCGSLRLGADTASGLSLGCRVEGALNAGEHHDAGDLTLHQRLADVLAVSATVEGTLDVDAAIGEAMSLGIHLDRGDLAFGAAIGKGLTLGALTAKGDLAISASMEGDLTIEVALVCTASYVDLYEYFYVQEGPLKVKEGYFLVRAPE